MSKEDTSPYPDFVANLKLSGGENGTPKSPHSAVLGKKPSEEKRLLPLLMLRT